MKNTIMMERQFAMLDEAFGKTITDLLKDEGILEIMLNPDGKLWAESLDQGRFDTGCRLTPRQAETAIKLVAAQHHLFANADHPEVACELLAIHCRFQGWLPPVVKAPSLTIRKHKTCLLSLDDYIAKQTLTKAQAQQIKTALADKKNILIAGGTGSGKTTFANALLQELKPFNERIIILEDLPELQLNVDDYVALCTSDTKNMRDLVRGALRMRPDRIIIGEVRDGAALELLKAWNTGHPGGICTLHANSAQAVISRLHDLIQEVIPVVPERLITEAVDLIIFMQRNDHGQHCVDSVLTVAN